MALFSRRQVQGAIDQCGTFMPEEAIARKVAALNACNEQSLPAEWEVMLIAAASRQCPVAYEPDLGGPRRADLLVTPRGFGTPGCLVEVTATSDDHAHKQNPYDRVCAAIRQRLKKLRAPTTGWNINVEGQKIGNYGNAEMRLMLGSGRPNELFDDRFHEFVMAVQAEPSVKRVHRWRGECLAIDLTFDPKGRGHSGGHLVYTVIHSLERNPLTRALVRKTKQLRNTGHPGPYGVVICDGNCDVLSTRLTGGGTSFSLRDILGQHFRSNRHLSFVLILGVETKPPEFLGVNRFRQVIRVQPFFREGADQRAVEALDRLVRAALSLPAPVTSPANADRCYVRRYENEWWRFPGGTLAVSANKITVSSRALLDMLAGRKTPEDFFTAFRNDRIQSGNLFDQQRREGRCIISMRITKGDGDDDQVEFTFGAPDAAVTQYRMPDGVHGRDNTGSGLSP